MAKKVNVEAKMVSSNYETSDYDKFVFVEGNRKISERNVKNLMNSMRENGYKGEPILVRHAKDGKHYEIIDGQHRFTAAKNLGISFLFMIDDSLTKEDIIILNQNQQNWVTTDYVRHYAISDNDRNYQWLQSMIDKHKNIPLGIVEMVALRENTYGGDTARKIKHRKLNTSEREKKKAEWELAYLDRYVELSRRLGGRKNYFYTALVYAYRFDDCDHEELYQKIMKNKYEMVPCGNTQLYLKMFSETYNKQKRKDGRVFMDLEWAKEHGRESL